MANPIKFFFLVAGHEFSNKGLDFDRMCTRRVAEWLFKLREGVRTKATDLPVTHSRRLALDPVLARIGSLRVTNGRRMSLDSARVASLSSQLRPAAQWHR